MSQRQLRYLCRNSPSTNPIFSGATFSSSVDEFEWKRQRDIQRPGEEILQPSVRAQNQPSQVDLNRQHWQALVKFCYLPGLSRQRLPRVHKSPESMQVMYTYTSVTQIEYAMVSPACPRPSRSVSFNSPFRVADLAWQSKMKGHRAQRT